MTSVGRSVAGMIRDSGHARGNAPMRPGVFSYWNKIRRPKATAATHPIASSEVVRIRFVVRRKEIPCVSLSRAHSKAAGNTEPAGAVARFLPDDGGLSDARSGKSSPFVVEAVANYVEPVAKTPDACALADPVPGDRSRLDPRIRPSRSANG